MLKNTQPPASKRRPAPRARSPRWVGWLLFALGLFTLATSIIYTSAILAFIGLGLTFWGPLLLYLSTERYVKQSVLDSTILPFLTDLDQILTELNYEGKGVYLPPKYLRDFEKSQIFIAKNRDTPLPKPEVIQQHEEKLFLTNPEAVLITPPGLALSKLFEETLGTSFTKVDFGYLQQNLPKLFTQDLEIAEDLEIDIDNIKRTSNASSTIFDTIQVKITDSVYTDVYREVKKLPHVFGEIGCPLSSAIACALVKATGEPVTIEKTQLSDNEKTLEVTFRLLEPIEAEERVEVPQKEVIEVPVSAPRVSLPPAEATALSVSPRSGRPSNLSLSFMILGSMILVGVGWFTWYDLYVWGKDLAFIFFGSRIGEVLGLGIGMRLIYYLLAGLALLFSGLLASLQRRGAV